MTTRSLSACRDGTIREAVSDALGHGIVAVLSVTLTSVITFSLLSVSFSSIFYILIFGTVGLLLYTVRYLKDKSGEKED